MNNTDKNSYRLPGSVYIQAIIRPTHYLQI